MFCCLDKGLELRLWCQVKGASMAAHTTVFGCTTCMANRLQAGGMLAAAGWTDSHSSQVAR